MSSAGRLARLKRSVAPMVNDVNNSNTRVNNSNTRVNNSNTRVNNTNGEEPRNMVQPMTILTWHEQRLNKIDELLKDFNGSGQLDQAEVVVPIVESIEVLEGQIKALQRQVDELKKVQKNSKGKTVQEEVQESLSQLKLDIKEKA